MGRFYIVRHAKTKAPDEIAKGHNEWPMAEDTVRPDKLKKWAAHQTFDNPLLVSSDLNRAEKTAESLNDVLQTDHETDATLRGLDFGKVTGHSLEEYREKNPEYNVRAHRDLAYENTFPGGESPKDVDERVEDTIAGLQSHDGDVIIVTHTVPILSVLSEVYNQPHYNIEFEINPCDIFVVDTELTELLSRVQFPEQRDIVNLV